MTASDFSSTFQSLTTTLLSLLPPSLPPSARQWFLNSIQYNVPGGKMNRGKSVLDSLLLLQPTLTPSTSSNSTSKTSLTEHHILQANILGWCVEWLQSFFLVADDMMDHSQIRRSQPCWYLVKGVGEIAINDAFMLESCIYALLKHYFKSESYYVDLLELFHDVTFQTELGQLVDLLTAPNQVDFTKFSLERYNWIVEYKTAYYSFYLPVALALLMAGSPPEALVEAKEILIPLGVYFQVQDDFLDCFGDPQVIGKVGTDIQDNKCSWLVNQALMRVNEQELQVLKENYGRNEKEAVERVKRVFDGVNLKKVFEEYEEKSFVEMNKRIDASSGLVNRQVYRAFMAKIYKRQK